jgi:MoxR-like ATPase
VAEALVRYAVRLCDASRPGRDKTPDFINHFVSWGAGLRGAQNLILGGKSRALLEGRNHVTLADIQAVVLPTLRHRLICSYRAEAEGMTVEKLIHQLLAAVPTPA